MVLGLGFKLAGLGLGLAALGFKVSSWLYSRLYCIYRPIALTHSLRAPVQSLAFKVVIEKKIFWNWRRTPPKS